MAFEPFVSMLVSCVSCEVCKKHSRCVPSFVIMCSLGVLCFLKLVRNIREVYQVSFIVYIQSYCCDFSELRKTRTNQEVYFTCIFHFKCGGRVGAPIIHGTDSHAEKIVWCSDSSRVVWSCSILAIYSSD